MSKALIKKVWLVLSTDTSQEDIGTKIFDMRDEAIDYVKNELSRELERQADEFKIPGSNICSRSSGDWSYACVEILKASEDEDNKEASRQVKTMEWRVIEIPLDITLYDPRLALAEYHSIWNDGSIELVSQCKIDLNTKEILEIEPADYSEGPEGLKHFDGGYVMIEGEKYNVVQEEDYDGNGFWYE